MSDEKAPANLKSSFSKTQNILCGVGRDQGAGRDTVVRRIYSLAAGVGKSGFVPFDCGDSSSSSCKRLVD